MSKPPRFGGLGGCLACVLEAEDVAVELVECVRDEVWQLAEEKACLLEGVPAVGDGCVCCFLCVGYEVCNHLFSFRLVKWLRTGFVRDLNHSWCVAVVQF